MILLELEPKAKKYLWYSEKIKIKLYQKKFGKIQ